MASPFVSPILTFWLNSCFRTTYLLFLLKVNLPQVQLIKETFSGLYNGVDQVCVMLSNTEKNYLGILRRNCIVQLTTMSLWSEILSQCPIFYTLSFIWQPLSQKYFEGILRILPKFVKCHHTLFKERNHGRPVFFIIDAYAW